MGIESLTPLKIINFIRHLPNFARLIYRLYKDPRVGIGAKIYVWGCIGYFIVPFDLFPDFMIPGLGYGEDTILAFFLLRAFIRNCPEEAVWEHIRKIEDEDSSGNFKFKDGFYR